MKEEIREYRLEITVSARSEGAARNLLNEFVQTVVKEGKDITSYGNLRVVGTIASDTGG